MASVLPGQDGRKALLGLQGKNKNKRKGCITNASSLQAVDYTVSVSAKSSGRSPCSMACLRSLAAEQTYACPCLLCPCQTLVHASRCIRLKVAVCNTFLLTRTCSLTSCNSLRLAHSIARHHLHPALECTTQTPDHPQAHICKSFSLCSPSSFIVGVHDAVLSAACLWGH